MRTQLLSATARRLRLGLWRGQPRLSGRHVEWSAIASTEDLLPVVPDALIDLALRAVHRARIVDLSQVASRAHNEFERRLLEHWPGEHYRLLAGLVAELQPRLAIEIGTHTGMGSLSMMEGLGPEGALVTYDVAPWQAFLNTFLRESDFNGRFEQRLVDLQQPSAFTTELATLSDADLIFIDGPKDGRFEPRLVSHLAESLGGSETVAIFDDIRTLPMLQLWRDLPFARLDLTSFGHWSGTGLCLL